MTADHLRAIEDRCSKAQRFIGPWTKPWLANAVGDIPWLVQEVKRLRAERDDAREIVRQQDEQSQRSLDEANRVVGELRAYPARKPAPRSTVQKS